MSIHALVLVFCCYKTWFNSLVFILQLLTLVFFRDLHGQEIQSNSPTHTVDTGKKDKGKRERAVVIASHLVMTHGRMGVDRQGIEKKTLGSHTQRKISSEYQSCDTLISDWTNFPLGII